MIISVTFVHKRIEEDQISRFERVFTRQLSRPDLWLGLSGKGRVVNLKECTIDACTAAYESNLTFEYNFRTNIKIKLIYILFLS